MGAVSQSLRSARPLAGAHWSLTALVIGVGLVLLFSEPCRRGPYYVECVVAAVTVCLVLWANHVARAPVRTAKSAAAVVGRSLYDLAALLVLFLIVAFPFAIFMPAYQCYTDRARAGEALLVGGVLRGDIEAKAAKLGTIEGSGRGIEFKPSGRARAGFVTTDGVIVIVGDDPAVVFMLSPTLEGGTVKWKCQGYPEQVVPMMCRSKDAT